MNHIQWILVGFAAVAAAFQYLTLMAVFVVILSRLARRDAQPPISVLKPVRGAEPQAYENFASFVEQDYPDFEVVFGVADPADPAVPVIRRLIAAYPKRAIRLVVATETLSVNRKVSTLRQMIPEARHDVVVVSDSDVRASRDLLSKLAAGLAPAAVGVVSTPYRFTHLRGPAGAIRALTVHTDFLPSACFARMLLGPSILFGATYAIKREVLEKIGGFEALGDFLADDYVVGDLVHKAGYRAEIVPVVVELPDTPGVFSQWLRWVRTYRVCKPAGWFATILTQLTFWCVVLAAASGGAEVPLTIAAAGLAFRWVAAFGLDAILFRNRSAFLYFWLIPIRDLLSVAMWALSFLGSRVTWRGVAFRVTPDGVLVPLGGGDEPATEPRPASAR